MSQHSTSAPETAPQEILVDVEVEYERAEADLDERSFPVAAVGRGSATTNTTTVKAPFVMRDDYLIPLEKGQAVNRGWPDVHQNRPRGVTWHWSAGGSLSGLRATIGGKNAARKGEASAHYGVGRSYAEGVDRYVGVENRSWHAGKNQLHRWDGDSLSGDDDKATRSTIGIETVGVGPAGGKVVAQADWISVWAATNEHLLAVQPWTGEQIQMMIAVAKEIQADWPHLTWRDHHGHEDLCPSYKQDVAGFHIFRQILVVEPDALLVAERASRIEDEFFALDQRDLAIFKFADANLRSLQITEDADGAPEAGGDFADAVGAGQMIVGRAMREIHPHDIDAGSDHAFENFRRR